MSIIRFENKTKVADITPNIDDILNAIYPIGVIVCGAKPTVGTWEKVEGKFLLGSSSSHPAGNTGGEESHTLTIDEMPRHNHRVQAPNYNTANTTVTQAGIVLNQGNNWVQPGANNLNGDVFADVAANAATFTGGGQAHNNMPPYLSVDMWRRIA